MTDESIKLIMLECVKELYLNGITEQELVTEVINQIKSVDTDMNNSISKLLSKV